MSFPTAQTIGHRAHTPGERGPRGNKAGTWAPSVDVAVYGWYVVDSTEPAQAGHARLEADAQVLAPETFKPGEGDLVELPSLGWFEVIGIPQDFNHGPFGWKPGNVINLKRTTG